MANNGSASSGSPPSSQAGRQNFLGGLSDVQFYVALGVAALLIVGVTVKLRFCADVTMPAMPKRPSGTAGPSAQEASAAIDSTTLAWQQHLEASNKKHTTHSTAEEMSKKFVHTVDADRHRLIPGTKRSTVTRNGLRMTAQVRDVGGTRMLALRILNTTKHDLAYRVDTRPMRGTRTCKRGFFTIPHNAQVVGAGRTVVRSECKHKRKWGVDITRVETVQLPALGAKHVGNVPPDMFGIEPRLARGHRPSLEGCSLVISETKRHAIKKGRIAWFDLVDFFARHSCHVYRTFPDDYKAFTTDNERSLPATK